MTDIPKKNQTKMSVREDSGWETGRGSEGVRERKGKEVHTYFIGSSPRGFSESILHYKIINQVHDNKNITMIKEDKGQYN